MHGKRKYICQLCWILVFVFLFGCSSRAEDDLQEIPIMQEEAGAAVNDVTAEDTDESGQVVVYVCGEVCIPGLYTLEANSRIYDAVMAAGGLTKEADDAFLNQAQILTDGEKIYVPSKEETTVWGIDGAGACDDKVSINRAGKEQLMMLQGIGEAKADAIIAYRETHGGFQSLDELMKVDGIKEGTYEKIKDRISL